jgi:hypothetical protein
MALYQKYPYSFHFHSPPSLSTDNPLTQGNEINPHIPAMWSNQTIRRAPKRMIFRQRLRISDIERRALDLLGLQRVQQGVAVDDGAARDVGDVGAARIGGGEELEFRGGEEVCGFFSVSWSVCWRVEGD